MAKTAEELEAERVKAERVKADADAKAAKLKADIAAGICDDDGVPYKNRAKEAERKRDVAEQLRLETQQKLDELAANPPPEPVELDPWTQQQKTIVTEEIGKFRKEFKNELKAEREAETTMRGILDKLAVDQPLIKKYRTAIEDRLSLLSPNLKTNPASVEMVADAVIGKHVSEILKENAPPIDDSTSRRLIGSESEVLPAHPSAPGPAIIVLTAKEQAYADSHQLVEKKWSNQQIRDWYKKVEAKKLAAEK